MLSLRHSRSMFSILVVPFVLQMVLLATLIGGLYYLASGAAVDEFLERRMHDLVDSTEQTIKSQLDRSELITSSISMGAQSYGIGFSNPEAMENLLFQLSSLTPEVTFIYVGSSSGDFIGVDRVAPGSTLVHVKNRDTQGKKLVFNSSGPSQRGEMVPAMSKTYDTLARPWYKLAAEQKMPVWTSVYLSASKNILEVTKAVPVLSTQGELQGVIATDLPLSQISNYLRAHPISEHGIAFVMEPSGALIASSAPARSATTGEAATQLIMAKQSTEPLIKLSAEQLAGRLPAMGQRLNVNLKHNGSLIEISAKALNGTNGLNWITVVAAPRDDFMGNIHRTNLRTFLISLGALALAIALGVMGLRWVTRDLKRLSSAAGKVGNEDFAQNPLPDSKIVEVSALSRSLSQMTGRLQDSMQLVSSKNQELAQANTKLEQMLHRLNIDTLTGVYNRHALLERLANSLQLNRHNDNHEKIALLYIDIDAFKFFNDSLGHAIGDKLLIEAATRLKDNTREHDTVARLGGDEFVVVLPNLIDSAQGQVVAKKILAALNQPFHLESGTTSIRASIGVAIYPDHSRDMTELINLADQAMYLAKSRGKNQVVMSQA